MAKSQRTLAKALATTGAEQLPLLIAAWREQPLTLERSEREIRYTLTPTPEHRFTQLEIRERLDYYFFRDLRHLPGGIFTSIRLVPIGRPNPSELARAETHFAACLAAPA